MVQPTKKFAEQHYADLSSKPFFDGLTTFLSSGPVVCMVWQGKNAVKTCRQMMGETDPAKSLPGICVVCWTLDDVALLIRVSFDRLDSRRFLD
jgi:nucleoside diphosphate kinase